MIPIPIVSLVYQSTVADTLELSRTCSSCGRTSPAAVSVFSVGEAETILPIHDRSETARERAVEGLRPAAEHALALAACPHCRRRERAAVRKVRNAAISAAAIRSAAVVPFTLALMTFLLATIMIGIEHAYGDAVVATLLGVAFVVIGGYLTRGGVRRRVAHAAEMADATVAWIGHEATAPIELVGPSNIGPSNTPATTHGWPFA